MRENLYDTNHIFLLKIKIIIIWKLFWSMTIFIITNSKDTVLTFNNLSKQTCQPYNNLSQILENAKSTGRIILWQYPPISLQYPYTCFPNNDAYMDVIHLSETMLTLTLCWLVSSALQTVWTQIRHNILILQFCLWVYITYQVAVALVIYTLSVVFKWYCGLKLLLSHKKPCRTLLTAVF